MEETSGMRGKMRKGFKVLGDKMDKGFTELGDKIDCFCDKIGTLPERIAKALKESK